MANNRTSGHESEAINVQGLKAALQKLKTDNINTKVDKVSGKGLSTNDYTDAEKAKLAGVATGAQVNVIETVKINGVPLTPDASKSVDVELEYASTETCEAIVSELN